MKPASLASFILILFFGCHQKGGDVSKETNRTAPIKIIPKQKIPVDTSDLENVLQPYGKEELQNIIEPRTLSFHTNIYEQPDSNSAILKVLDFGTPLILDKQKVESYHFQRIGKNKDGTNYTDQVDGFFTWYYVTVSGLTGYIKFTDVAKHTFKKTVNNKSYLYLLTSIYSKEHNPSNKLKILKYDKDKKALVDSLTVGFVADLVKLVNCPGWKNVDMMFRITYDTADCGCDGSELLVVDANNKLDTLISSSFEMDDATPSGDGSNVYLPVKTSGDSILFILNGDTKYLQNPDSSKFEIYNKSLPLNINFPTNELVIKSYINQGAVFDKSNEPLKNKDGSFKVKTYNDEVYFYRWDGFKLQKVLTVNNLHR